MVNTESLKGTLNFRRTLKQGKFKSSKHMVVYSYKTRNTTKNMLGICVSKKNGNSVERNKLKRWAKEAYKEIEKSLKLGNYIIILYKKEVLTENISFNLVKEELLENMDRLEMFENEES